jgi:transaldolase
MEDAPMTSLADLKVKIFADGADRAGILELYRNPLITGFTTNPTLMRNAGITDYEAFAREILQAIPGRPISLEVFSDDFAEMETQARRIASWGENVYVKIPVTNTQGESAISLIRSLAKSGVRYATSRRRWAPGHPPASRCSQDGSPIRGETPCR